MVLDQIFHQVFNWSSSTANITVYAPCYHKPLWGVDFFSFSMTLEKAGEAR